MIPPSGPTEPGVGRHLLLVPRAESERRFSVASWVESGLREGERFVYAEPDGDQDLTDGPSGVMAVLREHGIDLEEARAEGRVQRIGLADFYGAGGTARILDDAADLGFPAVRLTAAADHALSLMDPAGFVLFEQELGRLCASRRLSALCHYRADLAGRQLVRVTRLHDRDAAIPPFFAVSRPAATLRSGDAGTDGQVASADAGVVTLMLYGEVDVSNADAMTEAVEVATTVAGAECLVLDLDGLSLLTAAGCHSIVDGTSLFRSRGGQVEIIGARPFVQRVLRLAGVDQVAHISLVATP